jgi:predicted site-specific integrase-resolvase
MKVAIYTRVSTADKGQTVENQQLQLRQWSERSGYEVKHAFTRARRAWSMLLSRTKTCKRCSFCVFATAQKSNAERSTGTRIDSKS